MRRWLSGIATVVIACCVIFFAEYATVTLVLFPPQDISARTIRIESGDLCSIVKALSRFHVNDRAIGSICVDHEPLHFVSEVAPGSSTRRNISVLREQIR